MAGFVRELVLFGRPGLALTAISRALAGRMRNVLPGFHGEPEAQEIHEDHTQSLEWAPAIDGAGPAFDVGFDYWECENEDPTTWDGILNAAVPKRRTTRSVKRKRMQHKYLKPLKNIVDCSKCGKNRLQHHLCLHCLKTMKLEQKQARRDAEDAQLKEYEEKLAKMKDSE